MKIAVLDLEEQVGFANCVLTGVIKHRVKLQLQILTLHNIHSNVHNMYILYVRHWLALVS